MDLIKKAQKQEHQMFNSILKDYFARKGIAFEEIKEGEIVHRIHKNHETYSYKDELIFSAFERVPSVEDGKTILTRKVTINYLQEKGND